jgi:RNAse (barnase) inhibitor barstar
MPTGDPGIKPVELLSWAKDFKTSSVPFRIPGFSSPDSNKNPSAVMPASNPINCKGKDFNALKEAVKSNMNKAMDSSLVEQYADYFFDDEIAKYYGGNKQAFIDNIYAVIMRESGGRPYLSNNTTHDCGLGQIHVSYNNVVGIVNSLKQNAPALYNQFSGDINRLIDKNTDMDTRCEILTKNVKLNLALTYAALVGKIKYAKNLERGNLNYVGNIKQFAGNAHCYFKSLQDKYSNINIYSV